MSPRAWGCTALCKYQRQQDDNVPTCVGVYRLTAIASSWQPECPHVRGGVPQAVSACHFIKRMSPRTWGCTRASINIDSGKVNIP